MVVEGLVVEGGQTQAIAGIQAICLVLTPRNDVTCDQQARLTDAGDAASVAVAGEYCPAEKVLSDPLTDERKASFSREVS